MKTILDHLIEIPSEYGIYSTNFPTMAYSSSTFAGSIRIEGTNVIFTKQAWDTSMSGVVASFSGVAIRGTVVLS